MMAIIYSVKHPINNCYHDYCNCIRCYRKYAKIHQRFIKPILISHLYLKSLQLCKIYEELFGSKRKHGDFSGHHCINLGEWRREPGCQKCTWEWKSKQTEQIYKIHMTKNKCVRDGERRTWNQVKCERRRRRALAFMFCHWVWVN